MTTPSLKAPLVWDLPTRIFHWALVLLILGAWLTAEVIPDMLAWHARIGQTILSLVVFRILWGFVGGRHARFTDFIRHPRAAVAHLKELRQPGHPHDAGHNAAGGWMVVGLLALLGLQGSTGLFVSDGILFDAPLYGTVANSTSELLRRIHGINFTVLELAILAHILAVLVYLLWKRQNLIRPMVTGRKAWLAESDLTPLADRAPALWRAAICLVLAFGVVQGVIAALK